MKKSLLLITMLLLSAAWVVAQSTSSPSTSPTGDTGQSTAGSQSGATGSQSGAASTSDQSSQTSANSGMSSETISGCLSGSAGNYTLKDTASGKTYNLTGNDSDLSAHVGQEIQVKGSAANAGGANASATSPSGNSSASASAGTSGAGQSATAGESFNVSSVKKVSDTCSTK